jgi:hypothetical protein
MLIVRKGPTSHLPLHYDDNDDNDTIEIPPTDILGRIFIENPSFRIIFVRWAAFLRLFLRCEITIKARALFHLSYLVPGIGLCRDFERVKVPGTS